MKVALLAAGLGSRLGPLTAELPKALIPVGGTPLLVHALRFAARLAPQQVVVVGGFHHDRVAEEIRRRQASEPAIGQLALTIVENKEFRQGNILSLQAARPHLDDDFVLLNVDHIFRPSIAPLVAAVPGTGSGETVDRVIAFIDTDRTLTTDDMKVERDRQGRIVAIAKTLTRFDCGYVGMTRVPAPALAEYFSQLDAARAAEGDTIHVERILARLADAGRPPGCRDISGHGWLEVDTPLERSAAETAMQQPGWDRG